jgi:hypothetical protein
MHGHRERVAASVRGGDGRGGWLALLGLLLLAVIGGVIVASDHEAVAAEAACPGGAYPDPDVIWCDDFDRGTALDTWSPSPWCCDTDGDGVVTLAEMEFVACGAQGFKTACAAWTDEYRYGQHYADTTLPTLGLDELYIRWYVYISDPFRWDSTGDKSLMLLDNVGGSFNPYVAVSLWGTGKPHIVVNNNAVTPCVSQSTPDANGYYPACVNRAQNVGDDMTLQAGRWYLFEWYVKLNTPGVANGVSKLWVDDASQPIVAQTLRASYSDIVFRTSIDGLRLLTTILLTAYANNREGALPSQYQKWASLVVSRARIGPIRGFEDDFEAAVAEPDGSISGWDGPLDPSRMYLTGDVSHSGVRALELKYEPGSHGAGYMLTYFPGQDEVYHRWYQGWSPDFIWEPSGTGMVTLRPVAGYPHFYPSVLWGNGELAIQAVGIPQANWNFYQNQGPSVVFQPDRWYCLETFVKLNTPGVADGELAAWIDGELKLYYTGQTFRGSTPADFAPSTAKIEAMMISAYYGGPTTVPQLQFAWQDDHVLSTHRIGCSSP